MLCIRKRHCRFLFIVILFTAINLSSTQLTTTKFRLSDIEIIPNRVIINSTSITEFLCINHQGTESQLEANLSKIIPTNQMKVSTTVLNKTTIHIQLESNNYVGLFHLLCYSNGEVSDGNRADIIVKAAPGVLQLTEKCRVYDKQYIKCVIRAPTIATAIQNGYPPSFEFNEINHSSEQTAYLSRVEFLKNESTNEYLIFKWKPTVEGEFPNGVRMNIKATLPYFNISSYYFDMTPVFQITPKFILKAISSSEIQINLTPISPAVFCERSVVPQLTGNIANQTWTGIESDRNTVLVNNLLSNSIYRVCIKCRQVFSDPDGLEECQEIKTLSRITLFFNQKFAFSIIIILTVILIIIIAVSVHFRYKQRRYVPVKDGQERIDTIPHRNDYSQHPPSHVGESMPSLHSENSSSALQFVSNGTDNTDHHAYLPIASITDVVDAAFPEDLRRSEH